MDIEIDLSHAETTTELKDIRDEMARLRKREGMFSDEERSKWNKLQERALLLANHKEQLERDAQYRLIEQRANGAGAYNLDSIARGVQVDENAYDVDPFTDIRSAEDLKRRNPWDRTSFRMHGRTGDQIGSEWRSRALDAMEKMPAASPAIRAAASSIIENFDTPDGRLSRLSLALSAPAYYRGFIKVAMGNGHALTPGENLAIAEARDAFRAMSNTDADGGYLVPMQLDPTVIVTSSGVQSGIRSVARQVVATGDVWYGVSSPEVTFSWDAESTTGSEVQVSDDSTTFAQPTISIHKAQGFVPISIEALADQANVAAEVSRLLVMGRETIENTAFAVGTGSGQPRGIVTALTGTGSVISSVAVDNGNAGFFDTADLFALDSALPGRHRANASWLANKSFYNLVRQQDQNGGADLWAQLAAGQPPQLIGYRTVENEAMDSTPTSSSSNNYAVILGDFSNFYIADRIGFTVEFIQHLFGTNGRPTGKRGWYSYFRTGSNCVNTNAFRMLNI